MTSDNIVWGTDFRAGKEEAPLCNAPDVSLCREIAGKVREGWSDTAPSEYCAPSDDCA